ncbi:OmpA family protein [Sphingomonas sp. 10B4]|uniref:OmpA family protein n=1 Tax=Sphingomonas sp. 10B4 TaxID=3048575 RepID=UPI002AB39F1C|nr:OmpA family protein [Sphingomonas sp. 10B4]MDY7523840.1 OmpA family protein [Sphingomonas sp. 10B4]MEB0283087.1 OmpA family protein [Sphingomonas sp. 10B4]
MTTTFRTLATTAALGALLATGACATPQAAQTPRVADTAVGGIGAALGGYLLDDVVGGRRARSARINAAGIGGIAGAGIGAYMDRQEAELRARITGTDVQVTRRGDDLILTIPSGLSFAYKDASVAPGFQPTLDQIASVLKAYDHALVDVYGHTDSVGSDSYNQRLSEQRAASVAAYLVSHGVNAARVGTKGFGKGQPIASNETPDGQATNRRVEIKIVPIADTDLR